MSNSIERWLDNRQLNPFREMSKLQDSFDRLFQDFMELRKTNGLKSLNFSPSCEVSEEGNSYVLTFDLPGVTKDQVHVETDRDQITVSAERKEEKNKTGKKTYVSEISYGSYTRTFTLPGPVDEKKVDAKFENGVLTVTVPKTESAQVKQIPIH